MGNPAIDRFFGRPAQVGKALNLTLVTPYHTPMYEAWARALVESFSCT